MNDQSNIVHGVVSSIFGSRPASDSFDSREEEGGRLSAPLGYVA